MRVRLPANVDMPDRIFAGLTARQLVIVGLDGLLIWLLYTAIGRTLHPAVFSLIAIPLAAFGAALIAKTPEGIGFDRLLFLAARFVWKPKKQVLAPEGVRHRSNRELVAPISVPIRGVTEEGLVDLGPEGCAVVCKATGVHLSLRSELEQTSLIDSFARFLNSIDGSAQFLIISRRVELGTFIGRLKDGSVLSPHPALEKAVRAHIDYLERLSSKRDLRRHELLLCFREESPLEAAAASLARKIDQAQSLLRGVGVSLNRLQAAETALYLRTCGDPEARIPSAADLTLSPIGGVSV